MSSRWKRFIVYHVLKLDEKLHAARVFCRFTAGGSQVHVKFCYVLFSKMPISGRFI